MARRNRGVKGKMPGSRRKVKVSLRGNTNRNVAKRQKFGER